MHIGLFEPGSGLRSEPGPKSSIHVSEEGIEGITGATAADGTDECRKAVRKQVGAGADWIKVSKHLYFVEPQQQRHCELMKTRQPQRSRGYLYVDLRG